MEIYIAIGIIGGALMMLILYLIFRDKDSPSKLVRSNVIQNEVMNDSELKSRVIQLISQGKKIDAIKLVVANRKTGLAEGKRIVDLLQNFDINDISSLQNLKNAAVEIKQTPEFASQITQLLQRGKKIEAIKLVVQNNRMGLKEAKDFVDNFENKMK
ncbi:MAG: hypothetical protein SGI89_15460 [bacterium]|nr:hypothetical protein [bacterium]